MTKMNVINYVCLFFMPCLTLKAESKPVLVKSPELVKVDRAAAAAAKSGDISRILATWSDDAIVFYPGQSMIVGKGAIRGMVSRNRRRAGFSITWSPVGSNISKGADSGYTYGNFEVSFQLAGRQVKQTGDYVCIWEKRSDAWKCVFEMARPHGPPQQQGRSEQSARRAGSGT